jgi:hypothetical protein
MKNKPIIFLDIDGVLATVKQYGLTHNSKSWIQDYNVYPFDKKCVETFNEILEKTNAEIVLSSDWRIHFKLEELTDIFTINGVIRTPVDITPFHPTSMSFYQKNRAGEILKYVEDNNVSKWIAIDDMNLHKWLYPNFFMCKSEWEGIKQSGLKQKIIKYLNK